MRLLMITPNLPFPPHSGGALRAYGILRTLAQAGNDVSLLCFADSPAAIDNTPLHTLCTSITTVPPPTRTRSKRLRNLLFSDQADLVQRLYSPEMKARLLEACRLGYDALQFEGLEMATYLPIAVRARTTAKLIYDAFNAEYALQRNIAAVERQSLVRLPAAIYSSIQAQRILALESWLAENADGFIVVSPEDAVLLKPLRADRALPIVPSGIFVDDYQQDRPTAPAGKTIVFTGKMDYRPNVDGVLWFIEEIYPLVRAQHSDVTLCIVGQQPTQAIRTLAQDPSIVVTGQVAQVTPYLHSASVYVAPLRMGSGTRLKLLEAMACRCAIVATETAAAGLEASARASIQVADAPAAFAEHVNRLLNDPAARLAMGEQAEHAVRASYDWAAIAPRLYAVYEQLGLSRRPT